MTKPTLAPLPPTGPGWDIRAMRLFIVVALIVAAIYTLRKLLIIPILEENKLEVGLLLGWLIAKSGTVIDWLFGGSESGTRRAELSAHPAPIHPPASSPLPADAGEAADDVADAAVDRADEISGRSP